MDNETPEAKAHRVKPGELSKTPSWVLLGFLLGVWFAWSWPPLGRKVTPRSIPVAVVPARGAEGAATQWLAPVRVPRLVTTIEAVFAEWGRDAVWTDDVTEVALWNSEDRTFSDYYEVRRAGGACYFRSIPALTRRVVGRGQRGTGSPLRFTETEEQYREWREHGRTERKEELMGERREGREVGREAVVGGGRGVGSSEGSSASVGGSRRVDGEPGK